MRYSLTIDGRTDSGDLVTGSLAEIIQLRLFLLKISLAVKRVAAGQGKKGGGIINERGHVFIAS